MKVDWFSEGEFFLAHDRGKKKGRGDFWRNVIMGISYD